MRIRRSIGAHEAVWRHSKGAGLEDILAGAPWEESGCLAFVRIYPEDREIVEEAILARAVEARAGSVRARRVRAFEDESPLEAVARALGFESDQLQDSLYKEVVEKLFDEPGTLVLIEKEFVSSAWVRDIERLFERFKGDRCRSCSFVLSTGEVQGVHAFDLRRGFPEPESLSGTREQRWGAFAHQVVAWESGGDPAVARAIWDIAGDVVGLGDERGLSRAFASFAADSYSEAQAEWIRAAMRGERDHPDFDFQWTPPGGQGPQLVPSLARRLISGEPHPGRRAWLRSCLVCRPVQAWALGECLQAESVLRQAMMERMLEHAAMPDDAVRRFREREGKGDKLYFEQVSDAWDLCSLGELSGASSLEETGLDRSLPTRLSRIRNGLAHNESLRWRDLEDLTEIISQLNGWNSRRRIFRGVG